MYLKTSKVPTLVTVVSPCVSSGLVYLLLRDLQIVNCFYSYYQLICILITGTIKFPLGNEAAIPNIFFDDVITINRNIHSREIFQRFKPLP
jgi:hypothetical protein